MAKATRHPETKDFMTEDELDSFNLERFKISLAEGTLGNTGPWGPHGWGFGSNRWEKYFQERTDLAEEVNWDIDDTYETYTEKQGKIIEGVDDIDTEQPTDFKPLDKVEAPTDSREWFTAEGGDERYEKIPFTDEELSEADAESKEIMTEMGFDERKAPSRSDDNSFETKEQQKARLKKEIEERNRLLDEKAKARVEKRRAEKKDKDLDKEFSDFESELEDERLDEELNTFEEDIDKEKQLFEEDGEDLKADILDEITGETIDKHMEGNKANKGMLTKEEEALLDEQDMNIYIGEIEKAGLKGPEAQALAIKMMSMCGNR